MEKDYALTITHTTKILQKKDYTPATTCGTRTQQAGVTCVSPSFPSHTVWARLQCQAFLREKGNNVQHTQSPDLSAMIIHNRRNKTVIHNNNNNNSVHTQNEEIIITMLNDTENVSSAYRYSTAQNACGSCTKLIINVRIRIYLLL